MDIFRLMYGKSTNAAIHIRIEWKKQQQQPQQQQVKSIGSLRYIVCIVWLSKGIESTKMEYWWVVHCSEWRHANRALLTGAIFTAIENRIKKKKYTLYNDDNDHEPRWWWWWWYKNSEKKLNCSQTCLLELSIKMRYQPMRWMHKI